MNTHQETRGKFGSFALASIAVLALAAFDAPPVPAALSPQATKTISVLPLESGQIIPPFEHPVLECIKYEEKISGNEQVQDVTYIVSNNCDANVQMFVKVDLVVQLVGTSPTAGTYEWVADSGYIWGAGSVVLHATLTQGVVGQKACTRVYGSWQPTNQPQFRHELRDDKCR